MPLAIVFGNFGPYHVARIPPATRYCELFAIEVFPHNSIYAWESPDLPENLQYVNLSTGTGDGWHGCMAMLAPRVPEETLG